MIISNVTSMADTCFVHRSGLEPFGIRVREVTVRRETDSSSRSLQFTNGGYRAVCNRLHSDTPC
jgi:hypothetical protein